MAQVVRSPKVYDVCIIGSGAAGGTAAKVLTEGGLNVVMLEAGPPLNPEKDFKEHMWPYQLPHRGVGVGGEHRHELGDEFIAPNGAWEIEGEPYTSAPGSQFRWFRSRIVGGRTNHWGRIALRFAPVDFRSRSTDGMGDDWPITYEEVSPYYDKVESYIGVFGTQGEYSQRAGRHFSASASAALHRNHHQEGLRQTEHSLRAFAAGDSHQATERARGLPLLRPVRPRLHDRFQLQFQPGHDSAGASHRPVHSDHGRHGARDRGGKRWQGRSRGLHRQSHAFRKAGACPGLHGGGERLRVGAPAAEFPLHFVSRRSGQFFRRGRPLPDGLGRQFRRRIFSATGENAASQS